ncbi:---NA--- [Lecanosticta acicola]|uniref:---NA n=1 Tax=Lecanosticta acicola TaxID=111012 RepID=A0AAI9E8A8_9PEZI|nr:---NA--- [Lecanosticta acicola]
MGGKRKSIESALGFIPKKIKIVDSQSDSDELFVKETEADTGSETSETPCDTAIEDPCISDECAQSHIEMEKASQDIFFLQADTLHLRKLLDEKDQEVFELKAGLESEAQRRATQAKQYEKEISELRAEKSSTSRSNLDTSSNSSNSSSSSSIEELSDAIKKKKGEIRDLQVELDRARDEAEAGKAEIGRKQQETTRCSEALEQERGSKKIEEVIAEMARELVGVDWRGRKLGDKPKKL